MSFTECFLGDIVDLNYGKGLSEDKRANGDVNVYGSGGIIGTHNEALVEGPGIIIGRKGNVGSVYYEKNNFFPIDTVYYVSKKRDDDDLRFLYYWFLTLPLDRMNSDAAVPGLNREAAYRVKTKIPDPPSQKKIVNTLSAYDDLIDNNIRRISLLEKSAQLLYKEWFVRFKFPGYEHTKFVDGIPEGWKRGNVGDFVKVQSGFAFKSKDWGTGENPVIKIKNIHENHIELENCDKVNDSAAEKASAFLLKPNDLLIAMTGATVGKIGLMPRTKINYYLNQRVGIFRSVIEQNPVYFLFCFFNSVTAKAHILNFASGAAQPNISPTQIESIETIIPSSKILSEFNEFCSPIFSQRLVLKNQISYLKKGRDLLLPTLINGSTSV